MSATMVRAQTPRFKTSESPRPRDGNIKQEPRLESIPIAPAVDERGQRIQEILGIVRAAFDDKARTMRRDAIAIAIFDNESFLDMWELEDKSPDVAAITTMIEQYLTVAPAVIVGYAWIGARKLMVSWADYLVHVEAEALRTARGEA